MLLTDIYRAGYKGEQAGWWPRGPHITEIESTDFDTFASLRITKNYFVFLVIIGNNGGGKEL
jgi:hypothetical protein